METLEEWALQAQNDELKVVWQLPFEILHQIFRYVSELDLSRICRASRAFYFIAMPILYSQFEPRHFIDLLRLRRSLDNGMGPTGIDRQAFAREIINDIRSINLGWAFWGSVCSCKCTYFSGSEAEHEKCLWYIEETESALISLFTRMSKLRSFTLTESSSLTKSKRLWQALSHRSLDTLVVDVDGDWDSGSDSSVTSFQNLRLLHIQLTSRAEIYLMNSNLEILFLSAPRLQDLRLANFHMESVITAVTNIRNQDYLTALRKLEVQQQSCDSSIQGILSVLCSLPNLEHFTYQHSQFPEHSHDPESLRAGMIPKLKEIDISCERLLVGVLERSRVRILRGIGCLQESRLEGSYLDGAIQTSDSIEEIHFSIAQDYLKGDRRSRVVAALAQIPPSVKRLAIYASSDDDDGIRVLHYKPEKDFLKAIEHLINLERLILPRACIQHKGDYRRDYREESSVPILRASDIGRRATDIAVGICAPMLEYVFFGTYSGDDDVFCQAGSGHKIGAHSRYIVKVTRSPICPEDKGRPRLRTILKERNGFISHLMQRTQEGVVVKAELISAVCELTA